ncbi:MAG: T9SS type A sorting domain-containing protein [Bacteroidales bacterium]|nr:T9SS type A sorting domain-containing protein [Bacteroidales bacterium]
MKKHPIFNLLLIFFSLFLVTNVLAQTQINGVSDSTTLIDEAFVSQVDYDHIGDAPSFELLESPDDMTIDGTGEINWTASAIDEGGAVTVRCWNSGGSDTFTFHVYVSDEVDCPTNLISYFQLDETSGPTYEDYVDPSNTATELTALVDTVGMVGNAQKFIPTTATTQFLTIPDNNQWEWTVAEQFSFAFWCYSYGFPSYADTTDQVVVSRYDAALDKLILVGFDGKTNGHLRPRFRVRQNSLDESSLTLYEDIPRHEWVHLAFVYEGIEIWGYHKMRIYLNGELATSRDGWFTGGTDLYMNSPISIGWFPPSITEKFAFNGKIDELLVLNTALQDADALELYNTGLAHEPQCQPGNYAPLFTNTFVTSVDEDDTYSCTITSNDIDGDDVELSSVVLPSWLSLNTGSGLLSGIPTNEDLGDTTVTVMISDGTVDISKTFTITVDNTNDAPEIDSDPVLAVNEDEEYSYEIEYHDVDPSDVLELSVERPAWLNLVGNTLIGIPDNSVLGTNETVDFPIVVTVTDLEGAEAVQSFDITVTNINDAPVILGQNILQTAGNTTIVLDVETVYGEFDIIDDDNVYPDDFELTVSAGPNYAFPADNNVTPSAGFRGDLDVYVTLSDGEAEVEDTIIVSVINSIPVITSVPDTTCILGGAPYVYNITAEDADLDDELVYSAESIDESWLEFNDATQILSGVPTETGQYPIILAVTDGLSPLVTQIFTINVLPTGIHTYNSSSLLLYPIPAKDILHVELNESDNGNAVFELLNMAGGVVLLKNISPKNKTEIDISEITTGMYLYRITAGDNIYTGKLIVE